MVFTQRPGILSRLIFLILLVCMLQNRRKCDGFATFLNDLVSSSDNTMRTYNEQCKIIEEPYMEMEYYVYCMFFQD